MKKIKLILIITGILCIVSGVLVFTPIFTKTSTIASKQEVLPPCQTSDDYQPCDETDVTRYYFYLSDGHTASVDDSTYNKYDVGDKYTYTDTLTGLVFFLIPAAFFILALNKSIHSVNKRRTKAIVQWEKDGFLPFECDP